MCPKEILFKALRNEETERAPWVPFVGCHGGRLIDVPADEYLKSSKNIILGVKEAIKRYKPDGIPVIFDLQVEAEALGCDLVWAKENPPSVSSHVLLTKQLEELPEITEKSARIPVVLEAIRTLAEENGDVALYGLITGPFTLALHLLGSDIFLDMMIDKEKVNRVMEFCMNVGIKISEMYLEAGCDVLAVVDPMTSQISPEHFEEFVSPYVAPIFSRVKELGKYSSFFVCGHAQKNIEVMCKTKPDNICIDENIPLDYVKEVCAEYGISFGGNMKLTVALLMGSQDDCRKNAIECIETGGSKGFVLAPGCDIAYNTPIQNLEAVTELALDSYQREIARELLTKESAVIPSFDFSEYGRADRIVVDVITLDSESCAPCQYMVEQVKTGVEHFGDLVVWREHKIKTDRGLEFMTSLMVKNVPTICIDGVIRFVSIIPSRDELIKAIQDRIFEKFRIKIKQKKAKVLVFGDSGDNQAEKCFENVRKAITEIGADIGAEFVTDPKRREDYGVYVVPAIVLVRAQIKASNKVPKVEIIREWLKDI